MNLIDKDNIKIYYSVKYKKWKNLLLEDMIYIVTSYIIELFNLKRFANTIEVSIVLTNNNEIKKINKEYRNIDKATNVIALAINDFVSSMQTSIYNDILMLGDIVIAFEKIEEEAGEQDKTFEEHFTHLLVHALLHLIGYDHQNDEEAEIMEKLEIDILRKFDISTPYHYDHFDKP
jgi:probable rRNA maturation factor